MKTSEFREIIYDKDTDTGIVTVTLNIPQRKNAMSNYTFLELFYAVDALEKDETAYAMIITGAKAPDNHDPAKESFSSGGYFNPNAMEGIPQELVQEIDTTDIAQKKLTVKFWECEKPVVAAINGLSIGAGFTLPLGCADLIYASEHAWMRLPFVRLGIVPEFGSAYLLPRMLGFQKAKEIMYFGETFTAQEAFDMGLINKVVPHDKLLTYTREQILKLVPPGGPSLAISLCKRTLHKPHLDDLRQSLDLENEGLNKAVTTNDFMEAIMARGQKREPVFKGQ